MHLAAALLSQSPRRCQNSKNSVKQNFGCCVVKEGDVYRGSKGTVKPMCTFQKRQHTTNNQEGLQHVYCHRHRGGIGLYVDVQARHAINHWEVVRM